MIRFKSALLGSAIALLLGTPGCDEDCDCSDDSVGSGDPTGSTSDVSVEVSGTGEDPGPNPGDSGDDEGSASECYDDAGGTWAMVHSDGPSQCSAYIPEVCDVTQIGCGLQVECDHSSVSWTIDADGVTDTQAISLGDGLVADCHAEFGMNETGTVSWWMRLVCSAQGATCVYGSRDAP